MFGKVNAYKKWCQFSGPPCRPTDDAEWPLSTQVDTDRQADVLAQRYSSSSSSSRSIVTAVHLHYIGQVRSPAILRWTHGHPCDEPHLMDLRKKCLMFASAEKLCNFYLTTCQLNTPSFFLIFVKCHKI